MGGQGAMATTAQCPTHLMGRALPVTVGSLAVGGYGYGVPHHPYGGGGRGGRGGGRSPYGYSQRGRGGGGGYYGRY